jgi:hypothetical protein
MSDPDACRVMVVVDAMPREFRALVHEFGAVIVDRMMAEGYRDPHVLRPVLETWRERRQNEWLATDYIIDKQRFLDAATDRAFDRRHSHRPLAARGKTPDDRTERPREAARGAGVECVASDRGGRRGGSFGGPGDGVSDEPQCRDGDYVLGHGQRGGDAGQLEGPEPSSAAGEQRQPSRPFARLRSAAGRFASVFRASGTADSSAA